MRKLTTLNYEDADKRSEPIKLLQALLVGNGEFLTAHLPATGNHFAPVFRSHAATKSMFIPTFSAGWLIGTFHRLSNDIKCNTKNWSAKVRVFFQKPSVVKKNSPAPAPFFKLKPTAASLISAVPV